MKKMKSIFALLIAFVMVIGMSATVFAGTITITRDETYEGSNGRTYTAYKVFDADTSLTGSNTQDDKQPSYDEDGPIAYTMATDSPWLAAMKDDEQIWFNVELAADGSVYVITPVDGLSDSNAVVIAAYLNENLPSDLTGISITPGTAAEVDDGYYLIVASDGATNLTLVTTDVTIVEKNTYIVTSKTTEETSYSIGDIIEYTATVTIPSDASKNEPVILHDEMDEALSFDKSSVSAKINSDSFNGYTLITETDDDCTFEISIPVTDAVLGKTITFTYSAELTSAAVDPDTGFINTLYGEKNSYKTTPDSPEVYTFDFDFIKVFDDEDDAELTATFKLRTDASDEDTAIAFIIDEDGNYIKADNDDSGSTTTITMTNGQALNFQGFKEGTYYLVELSTSTGYNLLDGPVVITITDTSADGKYSHTVSPVNEDNQVEVENHSGSVLPSTGSVGTTMFYIIGGVLVLAAVVVLVARKRASVKAE